jgi:hypothetical protein
LSPQALAGANEPSISISFPGRRALGLPVGYRQDGCWRVNFPDVRLPYFFCTENFWGAGLSLKIGYYNNDCDDYIDGVRFTIHMMTL